MGSLFRAADARSSAALSRVMGERIRLIPWAGSGDFTEGGLDPSRPVVDFQSVLAGALGSQSMQGDNKNGKPMRGSIVTRDRSLSTDIGDWPAHARPGDHVAAMDLPDQPQFVILRADPDNMGRIIAPLVAL